MKLSIKKFADLTGVSVRTLHYYNKIGLLSPDFVDANNGYRYYSEPAMARMQEILFYRELDFSLESIGEILSSPNYDKRKAIEGQRNLLILKRERLDRIIAALDAACKGDTVMKFDAFDSAELDKTRNAYKNEVKSRWGGTDAYKEHEAKTAAYTATDWQTVASGLNGIIAEFAAANKNGVLPTDSAATALAAKLQRFITETQYTCTDEILQSLADMYVADERFRKNIDSVGSGTAEFMSRSIKAYCNR